MFKRSIKLVIGSIILTSAILFTAVSAPQLHNSYLRYEVGTSTVQVLSPTGGGGTGFAVKAASGKNYIATNRHVCEAAVNGWMIIKQDEGIRAFKRVVYKDNRHDICLIEGDDRLDSLELASNPQKGDIHYIVGHPGLRQLTVSAGEYIGFYNVKIAQKVDTRAQCIGEVIELDPVQQFMYGVEFICLRNLKSYSTTAVAYPGNSGSPVVNKYGNIIGILFAGSNQQERDNFLVPVYELERVLSKF